MPKIARIDVAKKAFLEFLHRQEELAGIIADKVSICDHPDNDSYLATVEGKEIAAEVQIFTSDQELGEGEEIGFSIWPIPLVGNKRGLEPRSSKIRV